MADPFPTAPAPMRPWDIPRLPRLGQGRDMGAGSPPARLLQFPQDFPGWRSNLLGMARDFSSPTVPALTPELMLRAYAAGIFPMSDGAHDPDIFWVDPQTRGIFPLNAFHVSRSLARRMRKGGYEIAINRDFAGTVRACADRPETWINPDIFATYLGLHAQGYAHSVEIWMDGELAGGVFGVALGAAFFGESMFSRRTDGSKLALVHLVGRLRAGGFQLFDTQFTTDHLMSLGAIDVARSDYRRRLHLAVTSPADFWAVDRAGAQAAE